MQLLNLKAVNDIHCAVWHCHSCYCSETNISTSTQPEAHLGEVLGCVVRRESQYTTPPRTTRTSARRVSVEDTTDAEVMVTTGLLGASMVLAALSHPI